MRFTAHSFLSRATHNSIAQLLASQKDRPGLHFGAGPSWDDPGSQGETGEGSGACR